MVAWGLKLSGCDPFLPTEASPAPQERLPSACQGSAPSLVSRTFVIKGRAGWQPIMKYLIPSDRCQDTEDPPMWELVETLIFFPCLLTCLPRRGEGGDKSLFQSRRLENTCLGSGWVALGLWG